jgi:hypothetical protein
VLVSTIAQLFLLYKILDEFSKPTFLAGHQLLFIHGKIKVGKSVIKQVAV